MENGPFIDDLPIKMVIFNSYVSLPEGILYHTWHSSHPLFLFMSSESMWIPETQKTDEKTPMTASSPGMAQPAVVRIKTSRSRATCGETDVNGVLITG